MPGLTGEREEKAFITILFGKQSVLGWTIQPNVYMNSFSNNETKGRVLVHAI